MFVGQIRTESLNNTVFVFRDEILHFWWSNPMAPFVWGSSIRALPTSSTAWKFQCRTTWTNGGFLSPGLMVHFMENPPQKWMIWGCPHDFGKLQMWFSHPEPGEVHNVYGSDTVRTHSAGQQETPWWSAVWSRCQSKIWGYPMVN